MCTGGLSKGLVVDLFESDGFFDNEARLLRKSNRLTTDVFRRGTGAGLKERLLVPVAGLRWRLTLRKDGDGVVS